jgi:hypothetical protein
LHALFYKRYWEMLREDIIQEVLNDVNLGFIPEGWNDTSIVLIPKCDNA